MVQLIIKNYSSISKFFIPKWIRFWSFIYSISVFSTKKRSFIDSSFLRFTSKGNEFCFNNFEHSLSEELKIRYEITMFMLRLITLCSLKQRQTYVSIFVLFLVFNNCFPGWDMSIYIQILFPSPFLDQNRSQRSKATKSKDSRVFVFFCSFRFLLEFFSRPLLSFDFFFSFVCLLTAMSFLINIQ